MFYLRIVSTGQVQNICLGNCYRLVTDEFKCNESWIRIPREENPNCHTFIIPEEGNGIPVYGDPDNKYYIVTDNGSAYERINPTGFRVKVPSKNKLNETSGFTGE